MLLEENREGTWITFMETGWEESWYPVCDPETGIQFEYDSSIMDWCRSMYEGTFGIAPTSQMLMGNAVRDNI